MIKWNLWRFVPVRTLARGFARIRPQLPLLLILAAFALRFHQIDAQSLWNDEGNSLRLAQRSPGDLLDAVEHDIHPPGYYLLLKAWTGAAGESEFSLRALSAFQGVLAVALAFALGRALFSRAAGVLAGGLVALSPFAVYYSQEARMYAQLGLLSAASMWLLVRWLRAVEAGRAGYTLAGGLALVNAAGLYTQYTFPFTLLAQGVLFALWRGWRYAAYTPVSLGRVLGLYAGLNTAALALFAPWLPVAWEQVTTWPRTGVDLALDEQLRTVLTWTVYGSTAGDAGWLNFLWPGALALVALWPGRDVGYRWRAGVPLAWAAIVTGALFGSGAYREANLKMLLPAQIALALLIGQGAVRLWAWAATPRSAAPRSGWFALPRLLKPAERRTICYMLAAVLYFLVLSGQANALHALYTDPAYARADYRRMAAQIMDDLRPGDAVILDAPNQIEVFAYYYDGSAPVYELPPGLGGDDDLTRRLTQDVIAAHRRIYALFWGEQERDPNRVVRTTLATGAYPVSAQWVGDVHFAQYAALDTPPLHPASVRFGEHIRLTGYTLTTDRARPGEIFGVALRWQTDAALSTPYKITVQLLAPDGFMVWQHDSAPVNNLRPTTTWTPGEPVLDRHGLVVPLGRAPGRYRVIVAVYGAGGRLPVTVDGAAADTDYAALAPLAVE